MEKTVAAITSAPSKDEIVQASTLLAGVIAAASVSAGVAAPVVAAAPGSTVVASAVKPVWYKTTPAKGVGYVAGVAACVAAGYYGTKLVMQMKQEA